MRNPYVTATVQRVMYGAELRNHHQVQAARPARKAADADTSKPRPGDMPSGLANLRAWAKRHGFTSTARSEQQLRERLCKEMGFGPAR